MIKFTRGNMFDHSFEVRVNTVNCVGVMGKGLALEFKKRYPDMFKEYKLRCAEGLMRPGCLHVWKPLFGDWVINFPTKRHWRDNSRYGDIRVGLMALSEYLQHKPFTVAVPALGCQNGGLHWDRVSTMIKEHLKDSPAKITVFEPEQTE